MFIYMKMHLFTYALEMLESIQADFGVHPGQVVTLTQG